MRSKLRWVLPAVAALGVGAVLLFRGQPAPAPAPHDFPVLDADEVGLDAEPADGPQLATFGAGCFWCTEAVFRQLKGVRKAEPGYSGGSVPNPTYAQVCTGTTGHAEAVQVTYDPREVGYPELLEVFWRSHDPTTPNRQGHDVGPQYRSVIFAHTDRQRRLAELYKRKIDAAHAFDAPLVTEVVPFEAFYPAEAYHHDYYAANPRQPYCRAVIRPKLDKLRKVFPDRLRND